MTWAQVTFAYCFGVLTPLVGILGAMRWKRMGRAGWKGFFIGSGLMGLAMFGCGLLAIFFFPHYPIEPVNEWLANSFTLPALAVALALFWIPACKATEHKRFLWRCGWGVLAVYLTGLFLTYKFTEWPY